MRDILPLSLPDLCKTSKTNRNVRPESFDNIPKNSTTINVECRYRSVHLRARTFLTCFPCSFPSICRPKCQGKLLKSLSFYLLKALHKHLKGPNKPLSKCQDPARRDGHDEPSVHAYVRLSCCHSAAQVHETVSFGSHTGQHSTLKTGPQSAWPSATGWFRWPF